MSEWSQNFEKFLKPFVLLLDYKWIEGKISWLNNEYVTTIEP